MLNSVGKELLIFHSVEN